MGLRGSTLGGNKNKKNKFPERKQKNTPSQQVDDYEDQELRALRRTIATDPESFILNNLMMSVQFFENFEEDMNHIKETLASSYEDELNKVLPPSKHVLLPDVLQKHIARNIVFTSKRQTGDSVIEPLQPIRMYIVHDNIEITEQYYLPEYSSLNKGITYNMMIQPSEKQSGYVRLRCLDETPYMRNLGKEENIDPSDYYGDDELYDQNTRTKLSKQTKKNDRPVSSNYNIKSSSILHNDEIIYEDQVCRNIYGIQTVHDTQHRLSSATEESDHGAVKKTCQSQSPGRFEKSSTIHGVAGSSSSGYHSDSSSYLYNKTTPNDTSRKIYSNTKIPSDCFKEVRINSEGKIYSTQEERYSKPQNSQQLRLMMADRQYDSNVLYISSKMFMNYFINLFENQLAKPLGFKPEDLNFVEDSMIYCSKILESHSPRRRRIDSYEITPTIWLQWPEYAQEWLDRPRSTWPDYNDINKVKDLGCHVIPENSLPKQNVPLRRPRHQITKKKSSNIYQEIEWQLTFPAAERYLETCMTRSQVQVYLIALMLHKTFLRPVQEKINGLTINHIRNRLFWLIEEYDRPSLWPDNRMGDRLIKLLKSLYYCISQADPILRDYFVRDKNMFQKVPNEYLLHSQKQLKRIIENPVMYVFNVFENIKHSDQFFPKLNLPYLLKILTVKSSLAVMNPALDVQVHRKPTEREEYYNKTGSLWGQMKSQKIYSHVDGANRTVITTRKAMDNIVEISERCADDLEGPRLAAVLDFFVRHFIKMADCCHRYRAYPQKTVYLDQADRLSIILSEQNVRYKDDAKAYRDKIKAMRTRITTNPTMRSQKNKLPETPKRNMEPIFSGNLKDRFAQHVAEARPSRDEQPYSTREDYTDKVANKAVYEVRFQDDEEHAKVKFATAASYNEDTYTKNPVDQSKEDLYKRHPVSMGKSDEDLYSRNPTSMDRSDEDLYSRNPTSMDRSDEELYSRNPTSMDKSDEDLYSRNPTSMGKSDEDLYSRNPTSIGKSDEDLYSRNLTSMNKSDEDTLTGNPTSTDESNELASVVSMTKQVISLTDNLLETTYI